MNRFLLLIPIIIFFLSCNIENSYTQSDWTLIFYLGDDYSTLNLTNDIIEIADEDVNTSDIRLIILYDGPDDGDSCIEILDSPFSSNVRTISIGNTDIETTSTGEVDMADKDTLKYFIEYIKEKAPADNYALYFGSHGSGFQSSTPSGLAVENGESNDTTFLTVSEIAEAVEETGGVSLITFDACNLGNIETLYELKDATEYVIASPALIPGPGNDYTGFVQAAYTATDLTVETLGEVTLQAYYDYYNEYNEGSTYYTSKSYQQLYETEKIETIVDSSAFKTELSSFIDNKDTSDQTFNYDNDAESYTYTDIYDINTDATIESNLNDAITIAVGGEYKWISIYTPGAGDFNTSYVSTAFAIKHPDWAQLLEDQ